MSAKLVVISPHADDEILGVGGTLLKARAMGLSIGWILCSTKTVDFGYSARDCAERNQSIDSIRKFLSIGDEDFISFDKRPACLDQVSADEFVKFLSKSIQELGASDLYIPFASDVHSDHRLVNQWAISAAKVFRASQLKKIFQYEVISETDFNYSDKRAFRPNHFENIANFIDQKIEIFESVYSSEVLPPPNPRNGALIRSLANLRGSQSGFLYAEAFELIFSKAD